MWNRLCVQQKGCMCSCISESRHVFEICHIDNKLRATGPSVSICHALTLYRKLERFFPPSFLKSKSLLLGDKLT